MEKNCLFGFKLRCAFFWPGRINWATPYRHYHAGLPAGSNTMNLQLVQMLMNFLTAAPNSKDDRMPQYNATEFLAKYVEFLQNPTQHGDSYIEGFHRQFLVNHLKHPEKPLTECAGVEHHDTASSGGIVQTPVLLFASLVPQLLQAVESNDTVVTVSPDLVTSISSVTAALTSSHVRLTHDSEQLQRHIRIFTDLLVSTILLPQKSPSASLIAFRTNVQAAGQHLGWDFKALVALGLSDEHVAFGGIMGPACYVGDSLPLALYLSYKYAGDTGW